jgi:SRSO17 transposase
MTPSTFENFRLLASGWVLSTRRRTVTELIQRVGAVDLKSYSTFHRFFNRARWSVDDVGRIVLSLALVRLVVDDTLCKKGGQHIFGTGMHRDALASTRKLARLSWGHNWVVVGVIVELPFARGISWCLPIAFRLYITKTRPKSQRWREETSYRTRPELAVEMLEMIAKWHPDRRFLLVGDSAYGGGSVLRNLPEQFHLTSRIVMDAVLFAPPPRH